MGWWSPADARTAPNSPPQSAPSTQPIPTSTTTAASSPAPPPPAPQPSLTRDHRADAELSAFLASFESSQTTTDPKDPSSSSTHPPPPLPQQEPWQRTENDISPSALRPRTMSCRTAFDSAMHCRSPGNWFMGIYRFGELQPCTEHWKALWFCMGLRGVSEPARGEAIAKYHAEREARERERRAGGACSEDVWEMRSERVERAFWKVPPRDLSRSGEGE